MDDQRTRQRLSLDKFTTVIEGTTPSFRQKYRLPTRDISDRGVALHVPANHPIRDDLRRITRQSVRIRCPKRLTRDRLVREGQLLRVDQQMNGHSIWVFEFDNKLPLDQIRNHHNQ